MFTNLKRLCLLLVLVMSFTACSNNKPSGQTETSSNTLGYFTVDGDSLLLPGFDIELQLSPAAEAKLKAAQETVIINATFTGLPTDTTTEDYQKWQEISITSQEIELKDSRSARFENIRIPKALYDALADKDIRVLVNVYSGRKSTEDNLIDCSIIQAPLSQLLGKPSVITGKLLSGEN